MARKARLAPHLKLCEVILSFLKKKPVAFVEELLDPGG